MPRMAQAERRGQIAQAALDVALRDGLERTTVREIAAEAGVSLGVLHYCFADKAEIMQAMAALISTEALDAAVDATRRPDWAAAFAEAYLEMLHRTREHRLLAVELSIAGLRDPTLAGVSADQLLLRLANVERFCERLADRAGLTWPDPIPFVARDLLAHLDGVMLRWLVDRDDATLRSSVTRYVEWLRDTGRPHPEPRGTGPLDAGRRQTGRRASGSRDVAAGPSGMAERDTGLRPAAAPVPWRP